MLFVQHNLLAENANRQLNVSSRRNAKTTEKLSSGYRINRAADDAAGLSISEKMRRQVRGLHQTVDNITEGVGYVQTAEGALNEVHDMLQRMNELSVKAANGTNTEEDRAYIDSEMQALKDEMDRIFDTTTFNEQKIWEPRDRKLLGIVKKQAVEYTNTTSYIPVTNENCGVVAYGSYKIHADITDGVYVEWMGYNGNTYTTIPIGWDELKEKNYRFDMADYFGDKVPGNLLYDTNGNPVFRHQIAFSPQETATLEDLVDCIDGTYFSNSTGAGMSGRFEDNKGDQVQSSVSVNSVHLNYNAAYGSNHNTGQDTSTSVNIHDFNKADDKFLEPTDTAGNSVQTQQPSGGNLTKVPGNRTADINTARENKDKWEFSFYMDGIGAVTGASTSISYWAPSDGADNDENYWWRWERVWNGHSYVMEKRVITRSSSDKGNGTLGSLMDALTGKKGDKTPGLLSSANGGDADGGGYINIAFNLTSKDPYEYADGKTSNSVGSFTLQIRVSPTDTEQDVLDRINGALNSDTILDFYTNGGNSTSYAHHYVYTATAGRKPIDVPVYGGTCGFYVQGGTEGGQHIGIQYEALSVMALGLQDTNTLTQESSRNAINEIKGALQMVSEQRSTFGAYQNRLEHAGNINANVEENTQAAESRIRDADIADLMMEYSINNIIMQAGTSMLTQANQSTQSILELLQ